MFALSVSGQKRTLRRRLPLAFLSAGLLLVIAGALSPARAGFSFCNKTSYMLASAIAFEVKGRWVTRGWFLLEPGQCNEALDHRLSDGIYYTYAYTLPAHVGGIKYFSGAEFFCTATGLGDFTITGQKDCERRGYLARGFARIEVAGQGDWTTTFTEPSDYTLEKAQIAGVQRLLGDIGRNAGHIDGYVGSKTRRALIAFKKSHKLPADATITSELFVALLAEARQVQRETGYTFCNDTDDLVWAAIGVSEDKDVVSTGWFRVAPHECTEAIKDRLRGKAYYTFAESARGRASALSWGGEHPLCVMENRFTIKGAADCEKRGYFSTGFRKVDIGDKPGFVQHLSETSASTKRGAQY